MALYLMSCDGRSMTGIYYLPIPLLAHELDLTIEGASKALQRVCDTGFCVYDGASEMVFVLNLAREQVGERLKPGDKRLSAVRAQLETHRKHAFYRMFIDLYADAYGLTASPDTSPSEAPSKPLRSQDQDQDQDQEQEQEQARDSLSPWLRLWRVWEQVTANGLPCGSPQAHRGRLELAWDACAARSPVDPVAAFERAASAYRDDCARRGKRAQLHWLCSDLGAWLGDAPAARFDSGMGPVRDGNFEVDPSTEPGWMHD